MGCQKLTYYENTNPLKVVYRNLSFEQNIAQRFLSTDPVPTAWESPYAVNRNNPIFYSDPNGDIPVGKVLGKIWGGIKQFGKNIGSLFTNKPWGSKGTALAGKPKGLGLKGDWKGLANVFRGAGVIGRTAPTGRMFNLGFNQTTPINDVVSSQGNPIERTQRYNFGNVISDHPRNKITGVQFQGQMNGWMGFFNVKGLTGQGRGWSIANSGLQNIIPTWSDPMPVDYMQGRSGIIPGLNLLPTALVNYAGDKAGVLGGLLVGTMAWAGNVFNRVNPALGRITSLEVQYRSISNTQAAFTLQYKARVWQSYDDRGKSPFIRAWHRLWYGYD
jgi:hypothetical protein